MTTQIIICENYTIWRPEILLRTIVAALLKTKCSGLFVENKRYQEMGKEYFTIMQMIVKGEGYLYFAARATLCPLNPPSVTQTRTHTHTHTKKKDAEYESDPRSNEHYLSSSENKAWKKKIKACMGFEPMTFAIPVQHSTNWAQEPTGSWSLCWIQTNPWSDE